MLLSLWLTSAGRPTSTARVHPLRSAAARVRRQHLARVRRDRALRKQQQRCARPPCAAAASCARASAAARAGRRGRGGGAGSARRARAACRNSWQGRCLAGVVGGGVVGLSRKLSAAWGGLGRAAETTASLLEGRAPFRLAAVLAARQSVGARVAQPEGPERMALERDQVAKARVRLRWKPGLVRRGPSERGSPGRSWRGKGLPAGLGQPPGGQGSQPGRARHVAEDVGAVRLEGARVDAPYQSASTSSGEGEA